MTDLTYMASPTPVFIVEAKDTGSVANDPKYSGKLVMIKVEVIIPSVRFSPLVGMLIMAGDGEEPGWRLLEIPFDDFSFYYFRSDKPLYNDLLRWVANECFEKPALGDALINFNNGELNEWHQIVRLDKDKA